MEMTKTSFNIAYKKKNSYYIVIGKFIYFIGFARLDFVETKSSVHNRFQSWTLDIFIKQAIYQHKNTISYFHFNTKRA